MIKTSGYVKLITFALTLLAFAGNLIFDEIRKMNFILGNKFCFNVNDQVLCIVPVVIEI